MQLSVGEDGLACNGERHGRNGGEPVNMYERAEQKRADFLADWQAKMPELKAAVDRTVMALLAGFGDQFTVFPDTGITELHCYRCESGSEKKRWRVGYHPSLDVLIEQARAHNLAEHAGPV
jgi:hypothetical protein